MLEERPVCTIQRKNMQVLHQNLEVFLFVKLDGIMLPIRWRRCKTTTKTSVTRAYCKISALSWTLKFKLRSWSPHYCLGFEARLLFYTNSRLMLNALEMLIISPLQTRIPSWFSIWLLFKGLSKSFRYRCKRFLVSSLLWQLQQMESTSCYFKSRPVYHRWEGYDQV